jgi:hypothetical protein
MAKWSRLKEQAPNLFKRAHFKNRTVAKELLNKNWIVNVRRLSTRAELIEFIKLWLLLKNVCLRDEVNDFIVWKWTPSDEFSTASTYSIQFQGSHPPFYSGKLEKAKAEQKVIFLAGLQCTRRFRRLTFWRSGEYKIIISAVFALSRQKTPLTF